MLAVGTRGAWHGPVAARARRWFAWRSRMLAACLRGP
nr:MAG TPA: hypothetical protein [Caudoviricetes sp.]